MVSDPYLRTRLQVQAITVVDFITSRHWAKSCTLISHSLRAVREWLFLWYIKSIIYFTAQNMRIQLIILAVAFLLSIAPAKVEKHQAIHGFKPPASHQLSVIPNNAFVVSNCPLHAKTPEWFTISLNKYNSSCKEQYLLSAIIYYESKFNANAQNSSSSAAGLAQYLDSTWARHGCNKYGGRTSIDAHVQCALFDLRRNLGKQWAVWPLVNNNKYGYRI